METITQNDQQLSIIEKSLPVFNQAGDILKANKERTTKALIVGNKILTEWQAAWNIEDDDTKYKVLAALDERSNTYLVKCGDALKLEKENRQVVTQIMDEMKKMFTSLENDIDKSKAGTVPAQIQGFRNQLAKDLAELERQRKEAAEKLAAKQREAVDITSKISIELNQHFNGYLLQQKQKLVTKFNEQTLLSITGFEAWLKAYKPTYQKDHFEMFSPSLSAAYHERGEVINLIHSVRNDEKYNDFAGTYKAEMSLLASDLLDKIPSKKAELIEADEQAKAAAKAAEEARAAAQARAEAIAQASAAEKERLEEESRLASKKEAERVKELLDAQINQANERKAREDAENARLAQEAEDARQRAEQEAEIQKQSANTMLMFEQEASLSESQTTADTRQGYEITVTHPAGFVEIFTYWFQNEGKNLGVDKIGNTKLDQMKAFVEKTSLKQGRPCIESKFLKFDQSIKTIAKKQKAA